MSMFKDLHPGGAPPLKFVAGKDATSDFYALHRKEILEDKRYARFKVGVVQGFQKEEDVEVPYAESFFMRTHSPYYNESHHKWRKVIRDFVEKEIIPTCADDDEEGVDISPELHQKMGDAGILSALIGKPAKAIGLPLPGGLSYDDFD